MKTILTFTLAFLITIQNAWSQKYDFNLFRYPDIKVRGLQINGDGRYAISSTTFDPNRISQNNNSFITNLSYFSLINTKAKQSRLDNQLSLVYNYLKTNNDVVPNPNEILTSSLMVNNSLSYYNRNYGSSNLKFVEYGFRLNPSANTSKASFEGSGSPSTDGKSSNIGINLGVDLKIGTGRIDPIDYVFMANYLAEDLKLIGFETMSQDSLFELGRVLASVSNRRIFDSRKFKIEQIRAVIDWLQLDKSADPIGSFLVVQDNLNYAFLNLRNVGSRHSFGITNNLDVRQYKPAIDADNSSFSTSLYYEFDKSKPLNEKFQSTFQLISGTHLKFDKIAQKSSIFEPFANGSYTLGYYPNSRTNVEIKPSVEIRYPLHTYDLFVFGLLNAKANYFINYNTRITGYLNIAWFNPQRPFNNNDIYSFNFGFNHFFY
jgi:hypothetical protein